ncbi:MAG: bacterial Ig-like domain-containing protein [Treponema sp.]|jgi:hypothetical protein|nr:bacterial Ig-like domain-containing protein [Treponema sp.]
MHSIVTGRRIGKLLLAGLILLAGCADIINRPPQAPEASGGGQVRITVGSGTGRTLFPRMEQFSKIELTFEQQDGTGSMPPVEVQGGSALVALNTGTWNVTASAYNRAEPPVAAARAVNTLAWTGNEITGNTHFALEPAGTGPGILRYTILPPDGIVLDAYQSWIRIEKDGEVLAGLNTDDGFSDGTRLISGAITDAVLSLEPGRYTVDIVLDDSSESNTNTAVYREAAAILNGLVTDIVFAPQAGDFLDPDIRATLTQANGDFERTVNDSAQIIIGIMGGGETNKTQALMAPLGMTTVWFTLEKSQRQTIVVGGRDAALVSQAARNSAMDGSTATYTLAVFAVDTQDIAAGGAREFTLTLAEPGKTPVVYAVTLALGDYMTHLHADAWPSKRVYIIGESFDPSGLILEGLYSDGRRESITDGWAIEGFETAVVGEKVITIKKEGVQAIQYYVLSGTFLTNLPQEGSFTILVKDAGSIRDLYFDYGIRRSSEDVQPNRYSVPLGRTLVVAPVKWHIPDDAVYEWKVDNVPQASTDEYLSFTPSAKGNYAMTVTAKIGGTESYTASTTVECVDAEGTYKRSTSGEITAARIDHKPAPGQHTTNGGVHFGFICCEAWGGYAVYQFDHSVERILGGRELKIEGNGFRSWSEPGVVWVMQDENGNDKPDDTWYELAGSHTLHPQTKRRYAVTYTRGAGWVDNVGGMGVSGNYPHGHPPGAPSPMTFVGTGLAGHYTDNTYSGYVDAYCVQRYNIGDAIQADGSPVSLDYIDFVKVQTSLNVWAYVFGEVSTEIYTDPQDMTGSTDTTMLLTGADDGGGQYSYRFTNNSGYDLTIIFNGEQFSLNRTVTLDKTSPNPAEYVDFWGGNVNMAKSIGQAAFTDR